MKEKANRVITNNHQTDVSLICIDFKVETKTLKMEYFLMNDIK